MEPTYISKGGPGSVELTLPLDDVLSGCATDSLRVPDTSDVFEPISVVEFQEVDGYGETSRVQEHSADPLSSCTMPTLSGREPPVVVDSNSPLTADVQVSVTLAKSLLELGLEGFKDLNSPVLSADLAMALCRHADPKGKSQEDKYSDPPVPKKALASGAIIVDLLKAMHKGTPEHEKTGANVAFSEDEGQALRTLPGSLAAPIYLFAATHREAKPWTDQESRAKAQEVFAGLLWASHTGSIAELLRGRGEAEQGIFRDVMGLLKPDLKKDTWELNPATKYVFSWTLHQVTRPWLIDYLDIVLPPSLLLSDDYRTENKILGVRCLHHIVLNVAAAELLQSNRAQVVYHALYNHLYTPEADLIQVVLSCLLDLLPVLERFSQATRDPGQRHQHTNDVLQLILTHMEMEHKILLRRVYAKHLPAFVERLGIGVARHLKRLERVVLGYLEVYDGPEETARLSSLSTLKCIIKHAWPRMPWRLGALLKSLLRLVYDVATDCSLTPGEVKLNLLEEATDCLILLDRCSQRQVKVLLEGISNTCTDQQVLKCLAKVQQDV
ncbi:TELO2-interacting protein 2 [Lissotriton helveticus]